MPRIALGLEYDGSAYAGWQSQIHAVGLQSLVERALSVVADHAVAVTAAGRTDAGVHATLQVVHFDTSAQRTERGWIRGTNTNMPAALSVLWAREVADDFHARHSALTRRYRYLILTRSQRPALERDRVCWVRQPLDSARMHEAAQCLLGQHDFSSFRAAECQSRTPVRVLREITVARDRDYVVVEVEANAFLHHMVRNIVGSLLAVGHGERPVDWLRQVLEARDRKQAGVTAEANGLYLTAVRYDPVFGLPGGIPCPSGRE